MRYLILFFLTSILIPASLAGQKPSPDLRKLFMRIASVHTDEDRLRINDSVKLAVADYASSDSVFYESVHDVRYLGEITSQDSTLKILSWNLVLDNNKGKYFSYIIKRQQQGMKNFVYPLEASYSDKPVLTDTTYTGSQWYGALYYSVKTLTEKGKDFWIVLGLDYGDPLITRKIIDVISFNDDGSVVFGKKWFASPRGMKYRDVFEYAATGMMTLRFNSSTSIVFDHLVPIETESGDKRVFYGSDYSFDSYIYSNGVWKYILNVEMRNQN